MVNDVKNDKIKNKINLLENVMIKIRLHFDYISIKIKFDLLNYFDSYTSSKQWLQKINIVRKKWNLISK